MQTRIVPQLPPADERLRLIIDTDAGSEIVDLYAIALALHSLDRFALDDRLARVVTAPPAQRLHRQPTDPALAAQVVGGHVVRDPVEPGSAPRLGTVLDLEPIEGPICPQVGLLCQVFGHVGVADEPIDVVEYRRLVGFDQVEIHLLATTVPRRGHPGDPLAQAAISRFAVSNTTHGPPA